MNATAALLIEAQLSEVLTPRAKARSSVSLDAFRNILARETSRADQPGAPRPNASRDAGPARDDARQDARNPAPPEREDGRARPSPDRNKAPERLGNETSRAANGKTERAAPDGDGPAPDNVSQDSVSQDSVSQDSVPQDSVPQDSVPQDSVSQDSVSQDSVPQDSVPQDSVSNDDAKPAGETETGAPVQAMPTPQQEQDSPSVSAAGPDAMADAGTALDTLLSDKPDDAMQEPGADVAMEMDTELDLAVAVRVDNPGREEAGGDGKILTGAVPVTPIADGETVPLPGTPPALQPDIQLSQTGSVLASAGAGAGDGDAGADILNAPPGPLGDGEMALKNELAGKAVAQTGAPQTAQTEASRQDGQAARPFTAAPPALAQAGGPQSANAAQDAANPVQTAMQAIAQAPAQAQPQAGPGLLIATQELAAVAAKSDAPADVSALTGVQDASARGQAGLRGPVMPPQAALLRDVPISTLATEISARFQAGMSRFQIRLDPPELGRIDVRLDVRRDGSTATRLVVERQETLDMLVRDRASLERALNDSGLKTDDSSLHFSLKGEGFAQHEQSGQGHLHGGNDSSGDLTAGEQNTDNAMRAVRVDGLLDIVV